MSVVETALDQPVDQLDEMGPIDFVVIEFPHRQAPGEGLPIFLDLVDRGIVRVLDLALIRKQADGRARRLSLAEVGPELAVFEGASSGLLDEEDLREAAQAIEPDSSAVVLVFENRWMARLATALRRGGAQLVAYDRLPLQAILAALDAAEAR